MEGGEERQKQGKSDSQGSGDISNTELPLTQLGILQVALHHFHLPRTFQVVLITPHMQMTKTGLEGLDN